MFQQQRGYAIGRWTVVCLGYVLNVSLCRCVSCTYSSVIVDLNHQTQVTAVESAIRISTAPRFDSVEGNRLPHQHEGVSRDI